MRVDRIEIAIGWGNLGVRIYPNYCLVIRSSTGDLVKESEAYPMKGYGFRIYENPESQIIGIYEHPLHVEPLLTLSSDFHTRELVDECFVGAKLVYSNVNRVTTKSKGIFNVSITKSFQSSELQYLESSHVIRRTEILKLLGDNMLFLYPSHEWKQVETTTFQSRILQRLLGLSLAAYRKVTPPHTKHSARKSLLASIFLLIEDLDKGVLKFQWSQEHRRKKR